MFINASMGSKAFNAHIQGFKQEVLQEKADEFLNALGDRGEEIARENCGDYTPFIGISHKVEDKTLTVIGESDNLTVTWGENNDKSEEISPILMAEFGSGWYAENHFDHPDGGQGKLNKYGHAFDPKGWSWKQDGKWYHSVGQRPTMPMYKSYLTIVKEIESIAKSIFGV